MEDYNINLDACTSFLEVLIKNPKFTMEWYLKAHHNGYVRATSNISNLYDTGKGVLQDHKTAFKWYLEATNKGYSFAQYNVSLSYELGTGVEMDKHLALEWCEKSATQGYTLARTQICNLNIRGYCLDANKKRDLLIKHERDQHKLKVESLEKELKLMGRKRDEAEEGKTQKENENKLLKQEIDALKWLTCSCTRKRTKLDLNKDSIDQLKSITKTLNEWLNSQSDKNKPETIVLS